ncbi:FMN-dependent NADH-azoreductase [Pectobacterium cacticida]|uniref:FMN dependent NADH:quinone oxidoreductase n=1 Tax=Pectobacterium cacticida TaxID=69221 RepID=A0ABZ2G6A6_9GAMM|nr:FMN-dependent NADH-azoreductase [Pectobacterium cacticida]UYX05357.1 FMN-dependent NADH-azoreductase [Pectobacterium cacticida]
MKSLLLINSSVRQSGSITRQLSAEFVEKWRSEHPEGSVVVRDLALTPVPHLSEPVINAFFTPATHRSHEMNVVLKTSDELVDELLAADTIVIGAPMYNLAIPSGLKAWIDHIARAGRTFQYNAVDPEGLVRGKKVIVFVSTGGDFSQPPANKKDFVTPYMRAMLAFLGMTDVTFIVASGVAMGDAALTRAIKQGRARIEEISGGNCPSE